MNECLNCQTIFEEPKTFPIAREGCPKCSGDFVKTELCRICNQWFYEDYYKGYCYACAVSGFSLERGLGFLSAESMEKSFFLRHGDMLRNFCTEDIARWIDFLNNIC